MTKQVLPFELNCKPGEITVIYEANQSIEKSGFDLFAGSGFDVNLCIGYPTMHAYVSDYAGSGYAAACAWIQIVTRREFAQITDLEPGAVSSSVDTHPTFEALGVPFFAFGFPSDIYDAPCNNLGELGRLEWTADTFLVTMPNRTNGDTISRAAGFRWGYCEGDEAGKRLVELKPLEITGVSVWQEHLALLREYFPAWQFGDAF